MAGACPWQRRLRGFETQRADGGRGVGDVEVAAGGLATHGRADPAQQLALSGVERELRRHIAKRMGLTTHIPTAVPVHT